MVMKVTDTDYDYMDGYESYRCRLGLHGWL